MPTFAGSFVGAQQGIESTSHTVGGPMLSPTAVRASSSATASLEARVDATIARLTAPEDYRDLKQLQQSAQMSAAMHAAAKAQLAPVLARAETGGGTASGALRK